MSSVGPKVSKFKVGDSVGVGCMVGSCKTTGAGTACSQCARGKEQYCKVGRIGTYNSKFPDGTATYGGYTEAIVVNEAFVLRLPPGLDMAHAAPLLVRRHAARATDASRLLFQLHVLLHASHECSSSPLFYFPPP